jgi:hypothetical protein
MLRKDDALKLRRRVQKRLTEELEKKRIPVPQPDSRFYAQESDGELFWIDQLSYPGAWPHVGFGEADIPSPGLRFEAWYFQKREESLLALICEETDALNAVSEALKPVFQALAKDGKYAGRYRSLSEKAEEPELIMRVARSGAGVWRAAPCQEEKLLRALALMVTDAYPAVQKAVEAADPNRETLGRLKETAESKDPLLELQARFNSRKNG